MGTMIDRTITVEDKRSLENGSSPESKGLRADGNQGMVASSPDDIIGQSNNENGEAVTKTNAKAGT